MGEFEMLSMDFGVTSRGRDDIVIVPGKRSKEEERANNRTIKITQRAKHANGREENSGFRFGYELLTGELGFKVAVNYT